ncbi:SNAP25 homologous protein SNAP33-like [Neltuma alba]|uniref:SNAP25 homologous protein SNAP33-like n=1 Tax=Neltuma alba TaxID=207710 RepID=UPI0010A5A05A|nr:SNAP25 homologous protein SNAP33-like [Prosopis alba]XP_028763538.1 SNAP25 homologous protein SNAP33-like [Prosopis alba]XP_028763539.1 SNAP25 homologous protein SNAP33-like [Prosopis alba]XP_028763540.1 SNAP25 homologous protein SNAP33-like [Prosopis alba]XP_028763541.1 SNAP25 homologous protein SNAP33-like [Prosopis alba]XP_028763542.1 SNAP25 homologous protein SNAP33-like [Prosopis alba]
MLGLRKSPLKFVKHSSAEPVYPVKSGSNPFDSDDDEPKENPKNNSSNRTRSDPSLVLQGGKTNPFDDDGGDRNTTSSSYALQSANQNNYRNDFRDSGGIENQSVQELENYAVYKAEETTKSVKNCLKIAENIREEGTKTLVTLHQQGEQITRSHHVAVDIDQDLSRGEKLLGSLGGVFSKTWKPKKTRSITGPVIVGDDQVRRKGSHLEQREKLGLTSAPRGKSNMRTSPPEPTNALEKVEIEKGKQDDALSDLSDLLGELKHMAVDMGSEIESHNKALGHMYNDVDELNYRVKGANQRGRRLLGK